MCDTHDIIGCAVCAGIERYEAPDPTEGKRPVRPQDGAGIVTGPSRPAFIFPEPVKRDKPQWSPTTDHPRWVGKRQYNRNRKAQGANRLQPSDRNQWLAQQLGVTL